MRHIAEQDRKFFDRLALKVYHSIYPLDQLVNVGCTRQFISLDNKILLPVRDSIQQSLSFPRSLIIIVILTGNLAYSDSLAFNKNLGEDEALIIESVADPYVNTVKNLSEDTDAEFLELTIRSKIENNRHTLLENSKIHAKNRLNNYFPTENKPMEPEQKLFIYKGIFESGSTYLYPKLAKKNQLALFIIKGTVDANGISMASRDTLIIGGNKGLNLQFMQDTSFLLFITNIT